MTNALNANKVLIVGSGLTAPQSSEFNLDGWQILALHHGWMALPKDRWDVFLHCHDAPKDMMPIKTRPDQLIVNAVQDYAYAPEYKQYYTREFRKESGYCRTIFFTGLWWALHTMDPKVIATIGCDMHYPDGDANTFYGHGSPDPLKHHRVNLDKWFKCASDHCDKEGIELVNFSPEEFPSSLPFARKNIEDYK